jgi:hypothetical protein
VAKKKRRKRSKRSNSQSRPTVTSIVREHLHPRAPSAFPLRSEWKRDIESSRFNEIGVLLLEEISVINDSEAGPAFRGVEEGQDAFNKLTIIHNELRLMAEFTAQVMGTAEWMFWLRRLRGQFAGLNSFASTEPYVQNLAEALVMRTSRLSNPTRDAATHDYDFTDETHRHLMVVHHLAGTIYDVQSAMKRCAKGQKIRLVPGHIPTWVADPVLDPILRAWDRRVMVDDVGYLAALGIRDNSKLGQHLEFPIGGNVPVWRRTRLRKDSRFSVDDPPPYLLGVVNLDVVGSLEIGQPLDEVQVALIILLWACYATLLQGPELMRHRATAPTQWGYFLLQADSTLVPAIEQVISELGKNAGAAISTGRLPRSSFEVIDILTSLKSEIYAPLAGCPIHESGVHAVVDVFGASDRLLSTLGRPRDGAVRPWTTRFEDDVQRVIDDTAWGPKATVESLKGKPLKRRDKSTLTDIDAVAMKGNRLLLVSCKSAPVTLEIARGSFAETRNARDRAHAYLDEWEGKVQEVRNDPALLGIALPPGTKIDGCVVFPSVPYFTEPAGNRRVFGLIPVLLSLSELERALRKA